MSWLKEVIEEMEARGIKFNDTVVVNERREFKSRPEFYLTKPLEKIEFKEKPWPIKEIDPELKKYIEDKTAYLAADPYFAVDFGYKPSVTAEYALPYIDGSIVWAHRSVAIPEIMRKVTR